MRTESHDLNSTDITVGTNDAVVVFHGEVDTDGDIVTKKVEMLVPPHMKNSHPMGEPAMMALFVPWAMSQPGMKDKFFDYIQQKLEEKKIDQANNVQFDLET